MKATGIVRRIDACVIIGQTAWNPHKYWVFGQLLKKDFWQKTAYFDLYIKQRSENHSAVVLNKYYYKCTKS